MIPLTTAREIIDKHVHVLPPERVPLASAMRRVLRETITCSTDMPPFTRSAFDGYAACSSDLPGKLRISATVASGSAFKQELLSGECARIFTGAPLPQGADVVAMQEQCNREGDFVNIPGLARGHGVRWQGEDAKEGAIMLDRGVRLRAVELSLLAQNGHAQPLITPAPRVLHVVTGDELVSPDARLLPGQIRDSNSTLIAALVSEQGALLVAQHRAGDALSALVDAVGKHDWNAWNVLLISGGASVGDYDFGARALRELSFSVCFSQVDLRPGKPLTFATRGRQFAFVLPGNPLSHWVCWHVIVRQALEVMEGGGWHRPLFQLPHGGNFALEGHPRETWWPARLLASQTGLTAQPLKWQSSGDMTALAGCDLLLRIPAKSAPIHPGELVEAMLL